MQTYIQTDDDILAKIYNYYDLSYVKYMTQMSDEG